MTEFFVDTSFMGRDWSDECRPQRMYDLKRIEEETADIPLMSIKEMERLLILKALGHTKGNATRAAKLLGLSTLRNKLRDYEQRGILPLIDQ